jgi:hypothetical protein
MSNRDILNDLLAGKGKSGSNFQDTDANTLINAINSADPTQKANNFNQTLNELQSSAQSYKTNKKFKEAAHLFYLGGMLSKYFYPTNKQDFSPWFKNSINNLIALSEEYMTWNEIDRASAVIALANLLNFFTEETWELEEFYSNFLSKHSNIIQQGKTASGSLWVPNFIVTAIKELNSETLQQADQYTQMYLLSEAKTTILYKDGIIEILNLAREKLSKSVQVPTLKIDALLPKDALFGEQFPIELTIIKGGQGQMKNITLNFNPPAGIKKISDNSTERLQSLEMNQQTNLKFTFSSDHSSKEEVEFQFVGNVHFEDIIDNRRSFPIGPYSLVIRSSRKADKLKGQLDSLRTSLDQKFSLLDSNDLPESIKSQRSAIIDLYNNIISQIRISIDSGNFEAATVNMEFLNKPENLKLFESQQEIHTNVQKSKDTINSFNQGLEQVIEKNKEILQDLRNRTNNLQKIISNQ